MRATKKSTGTDNVQPVRRFKIHPPPQKKSLAPLRARKQRTTGALQKNTLAGLLNFCDPNGRKNIKKFIKNNFLISGISVALGYSDRKKPTLERPNEKSSAEHCYRFRICNGRNQRHGRRRFSQCF
ncbi:MAG: hypothetical protein H7A09_02240 [Oceanospirillaceae bacterium]|nr:hypothetical protein [Oceanospirillaceae bacterium]MCP5350803.1 hypothetical protein [Oceanospirillaceae bacterium]